MERSYIYKMGILFVFMVWMVVTSESHTCPNGSVFDTRAEECRQCGLCCEKHEPQDGCMSQGFNRSHSCIRDAACTDPDPVRPAEDTPREFWKWIVGVSIGTVVLVAGIIGLTLYLCKPRESYERLNGDDAAVTPAPPAPTPAAEDGETAAGGQEQGQDVEFSSIPTQVKLEAQPDSVGPRRPSGGAVGGNHNNLPNDELTNASIETPMVTDNSEIDPDTANQPVQTAPSNPGNQQSQGSSQNQQFSAADQTRRSNAASTECEGVGAGVVDPNAGVTSSHPPTSSNLPEHDSDNAQSSSRRSTMQNNEYVPSLGGGDPDQTHPKTLE